MRTSQIFSKEYNRQANFMTPNIMAYGESGTLVWELSSGRGFTGGKIYGVTVLEPGADPVRRTDLSDCFQSKAEALRYIASLEVE